jgi:hypothetical protein
MTSPEPSVDASIDGAAPIGASLIAPIEDDFNCGIFDLRSRTARGNILVIDCFVDPEALRREAKDTLCENLKTRRSRIEFLVSNDSQLDSRAKEVTLKLLPEYRNELGLVLLMAAVFACLALGAGLVCVIASSSPNDLGALENGVFWTCIGGVLGVGLVGWGLWRWRKLWELEQELVKVRDGVAGIGT